MAKITKIEGLALTVEPSTFVQADGQVVNYYVTKLILPSGADLPVKIKTDYANLLLNGYLK